MKWSVFLGLISFCFIVACNDETPSEPTITFDALQEQGILGRWEISWRVTNGISAPVKMCCEFLEFSTNAEDDDLIGNFVYMDARDTREGQFELLTNEKVMLIRRDNSIDSFNYQIDNGLLVLSYTIDDILHEDGYAIKLR